MNAFKTVMKSKVSLNIVANITVKIYPTICTSKSSNNLCLPKGSIEALDVALVGVSSTWNLITILAATAPFWAASD